MAGPIVSPIDPDLVVDPCLNMTETLVSGKTKNVQKSAVHGLHCSSGIGVLGISREGIGINGVGVDGVQGESQSGNGVVARSSSGSGLLAESRTGAGVVARSRNHVGVWAESRAFEAIHAESFSTEGTVAAYNNNEGEGFAIYGKKAGDRGHAGFFDGTVWVAGNLGVGQNVEVHGDIFLTSADCAEEFDLLDGHLVEPGMVMVLADGGSLRPSYRAYDKRVAGVISGAGSFKPAITLDRRNTGAHRLPIALVGKVFCRVDASFGPIEPGDLLTTSSAAGHAMKATDATAAFGAVIGKALQGIASGRGLIPILVTLQ